MTEKCGCKIVNVDLHYGLNVDHPLKIEYCPLHESAEGMRDFIKDSIGTLSYLEKRSSMRIDPPLLDRGREILKRSGG